MNAGRILCNCRYAFKITRDLFYQNYLTVPFSTPLQTGMAYSSSRTAKFMIVGLGNHDLPNTRHNVGLTLVNKLVQYFNTDWRKEADLQGFVAQASFTRSPGDSEHINLVLVKSKLPMNINGRTVASAARKYEISSENIYLLQDDLDKPVGKFRIKEGGSASGHNGVKSCQAALQSQNMPRLMVGIDRPTTKTAVTDYVLSRFDPDQLKIMEDTWKPALHLLLTHIGKRSGTISTEQRQPENG